MAALGGRRVVFTLVLIVGGGMSRIAHACSGHANHNHNHRHDGDDEHSGEIHSDRQLQFQSAEDLWAANFDSIQTSPRCGAPEAAPEDMEKMAQAVVDWRLTRQENARLQLIEVPLYIHVIINSDGDGGVTTTQIEDQVLALDAAFGPQGIKFNLQQATRTVNNDWYRCKLGGNEIDMKRELREGGSESLNIYLCNPQDFLGWATLPVGYEFNPTYDGIVVQSRSVPGGSLAPYNKGNTATHEAGHWMGLQHTFKGGCNGDGDGIDDTPAERKPAFGCPIGRDTCSGEGLDPVNNYMAYTDDDCMTEFTPGQREAMFAQYARFRGAVIETSVPTSFPTTLPTSFPTGGPTKAPTSEPTNEPTSAPTRAPSNVPTRDPTNVPTEAPTSEPTQEPTMVPTMSPSRTPTSSPSRSPTWSPTSGPTVGPSEAPSKVPTTSPTSLPASIEPTLAPTKAPTEGPTPSPSSRPTRDPSRTPTKMPSAAPSIDPTHVPSSQPNGVPTKLPSIPVPLLASDLTFSAIDIFANGAPSVTPSTTLSNQPSSPPTRDPTRSPTPEPSNTPTTSTTKAPTFGPSVALTSAPSIRPTGSPTRVPTFEPTVLLSNFPSVPSSDVPTSSPSEEPTSHPTSSPTQVPTSTPTATPSVSPTTAPTVSPTAVPTPQPSYRPTIRPTQSPTRPPTVPPTFDPSVSPTMSPTSNPTNQPSGTPTAPPTTQPTNPPVDSITTGGFSGFSSFGTSTTVVGSAASESAASESDGFSYGGFGSIPAEDETDPPDESESSEGSGTVSHTGQTTLGGGIFPVGILAAADTGGGVDESAEPVVVSGLGGFQATPAAAPVSTNTATASCVLNGARCSSGFECCSTRCVGTTVFTRVCAVF